MTDKAREPAEVSRPLTGYLWGGIGGAELPLSFADSCHRADRNGCRRFSRGLLGNRGYRADRPVRAVAEPTTKGLQQVTVRCRIRYGSRPTVCQMLITRVYIYIIAGEN